ncbi:MAG: Rrf2 family transcriptional regulator [Acidimicrobiales bacterium]|nr:Rrf2 family transcriptional regulator [Acidimicrobiia bacterium]MBT8249124.1 Rrf2 family transcriptional regulator [Acidimicrobiia bacterium]NNC43632.1 Rrf2 family transcriptional regulator [Acidimicrobiia bacterium]NNF53008.1 Rrf2 family transcriptional regulator [Acidimicrobiales bacterium]NNL27296.1 Rrf2 family transcriptional regulator [Acidimicrobiia bacterium]
MQINLQKKTELAMRALRTLSTDSATAGSDLAGRIGTSLNFLSQVMAPLVRSGWVTSDRGPNGGYRLEQTAVSLLDLIEAVEGEIPTNRCVLRGSKCPGTEACALHELWLGAQEALTAELRQIPVLST